MIVPVIETPRLLLREFSNEDFEGYARICADPHMMQYIGEGRPLLREEAWRSLAFFLGHWRLRGFGLWAVVEKSSRQFIGRIGFYQPDGWPGFELGWFVDRRVWGRGLATEGAKAVLPLASSTYGQSHVISLIHPENAASIRVAEKIGETYEGETTINEKIVLVYGIDVVD